MRRTRRSTLRILPCLAALAALGVSAPLAGAFAQAAGYPDRPVRLVVATAAGGAMDAVARGLADKLALKLGQPIVVENRPGAGSSLAGQYVVRSPADGHTLLFVSSGYSTLPALYPQLPFALNELAPVAVAASVPYVFVVPPDAPHRTMKDFVDHAKSRPKQLNFASGGNATGGHLLGVWFKSETKLDLEHIPYKGEAPALQAMLGGQLSLMPVTVTLGAPLVKAGKLRALAVSGAKRSPQLPEVPTLAESGIAVQSVVWFGMLAPAATPKAVLAKLNDAVNKALNEWDLRDKLQSTGMTVEGGSAAEFQSLIDRESAHWARLIKEAGIRAE
jgi:tripartite-type tricarboxylate transporter receptor subunit TctC